MYRELQQTNRYLKELNKLLKRDSKQFDMEKLRIVIEMLQNGETIPAKYSKHPLQGELNGYMDIHITPDWVLIYKTDEEYVYLHRTGTHSDIYG
jgi:mRNA interferase YafQ